MAPLLVKMALVILLASVIGLAQAQTQPPPVETVLADYDDAEKARKFEGKLMEQFEGSLTNAKFPWSDQNATLQMSLTGDKNEWNMENVSEDAYAFNEIPRSDWMSKVPDDLLISRMSIPGTHNSCARYQGDMVQCQTMQLMDQLTNGVRFLDVRCRVYGEAFTIHHGIFYQDMVFGAVLNQCIEFLDKHPMETILMRIKQEYSSVSNKEFKRIFNNYLYTKGPPFGTRMFTENRIPSLKEVRGKITIIENVFRLPGIQWITIDVHDDYWVPTIFHLSAKWEKVQAHLKKASQALKNGSARLFITFASGTGFGVFPYTVAKYVNRNLYHFFKAAESNACYGIVAMDFPGYYDDGVIDELIKRNTFDR